MRDHPSFFSSASCGRLGTASAKRGPLGVLYALVLFLGGQRGKVARHYLGEAVGKLACANSLAFFWHLQSYLLETSPTYYIVLQNPTMDYKMQQYRAVRVNRTLI